MPNLSIIIVTFNAEKTLATCLESVVTQSYLDKEILLIDGNSSDNTLKIIQNYASMYPFIRWISEKDKGIYDAMNKGIAMSEGEWLYFLGSDDTLFDYKVMERVFVEQQATVSKADYIYSNVIWGETGLLYGGYYDVLRLYSTNICHQGMFVRRNVFEKIGNFSMEYPVLADYYFNMRCFTEDSIRKEYLGLIVAKYAVAGASSYTKDPFTDQRYQQFAKNMKKISLETQLQFRILHGNRQGLKNKIEILLSMGLRDILNSIFVRKLRKIYAKMRQKTT